METFKHFETTYAIKKKLVFDNNFEDNYIKTLQESENKQKLFDFISDKKKFSLKSNFDQKGTKSFLNGKDIAMQKIELNDEIENEEMDNQKNVVKKSPNKKLYSSKSYKLVTLNKINKKYNKQETKIKNGKRKNSKSSKYLSIFSENNLKLKGIKNDDFALEDDFKSNIIKTDIKTAKKYSRKSLSKKPKKNKDLIINKSIGSILTVDSKKYRKKKYSSKYETLEEILFVLDQKI